MGYKLKRATIRVNNTTRGLPAEYQEVEYIQSSGTQYINTGYTPLTTTEFDITYEWVSFLSQWQTPMGCRKDYNTQAYYFGWDKVNSRSFYGFGTNHVDPSSVAFGGLGQIFNVTYKNGVISNGTNSANVTVSNAPYGHLCIFAEEHNGNVQEYSCMKLYGLKLYESGTLIRDFVPCYRIADSVIGLYDVVNDVFYTNSGTGTFTKGAEVLDMVEKQIRPSGWQPGANTMLYMPLKNDIIDYSGNNRNITINSGTVSYSSYGGIPGVEFGDGTGLILASDISNVTYNSYTILCRCYMLSFNNYWNYLCGFARNISSSYYDCLFVSDTGKWSYYSGGNSISTQNVQTGGWHLLALTSDATRILYYDANPIVSGSGNTYTFNYVSIGGRLDYGQHFGGSIRDLIVENKVWTAQEISDYYDLTKSNYGL